MENKNKTKFQKTLGQIKITNKYIKLYPVFGVLLKQVLLPGPERLNFVIILPNGKQFLIRNQKG